MVRRDGAEARKKRINEIAQYAHKSLEANNGEIPLKKTISKIAIEWGLTKARIMEYLELLADDGHFILDVEGDKIKKIIYENADSDG